MILWFIRFSKLKRLENKKVLARADRKGTQIFFWQAEENASRCSVVPVNFHSSETSKTSRTPKFFSLKPIKPHNLLAPQWVTFFF